MLRRVEASAWSWAGVQIGVDVARYGDDRTVLFARQGVMAHRPEVMRHAHGSAVSAEIATLAMAMAKHYGTRQIVMDATGGWAAGARDVLVTAGYMPLEVQFHAPCPTKDGVPSQYRNRRAQMHFALSEWVKKGGCLPNVPELVGELTVPTYTVREDGKFQIEAKDQVKERLGRSPDLADALALTFAYPVSEQVDTRDVDPPVFAD